MAFNNQCTSRNQIRDDILSVLYTAPALNTTFHIKQIINVCLSAADSRGFISCNGLDNRYFILD